MKSVIAAPPDVIRIDCSSSCKWEVQTELCPCADYQKWNDVLADESFICGPAGIYWTGAHYFVYRKPVIAYSKYQPGGQPDQKSPSVSTIHFFMTAVVLT